MISSTEQEETSESIDRLAAYFTLTKDHRIKKLSWYGLIPDWAPRRSDDINSAELLPLQDPGLRAALDRSFAGESSSFQFQRRSNSGLFCAFNLLCFPSGEQGDDSINCVISETCVEKEISEKLQAKIRDLDIINQAVRAFSETKNLTDILRIVLLAVTSGSGLGFNRGFIFLADDSETLLHGCLATGPSSSEDAGAIWQSLSARPLPLEEVLRLYKADPKIHDGYVNKLVVSLQIPIAGGSNFLSRAILEKKSIIVGPDMMLEGNDPELRRKFGVDELAVVPFISMESRLGVIVADNMVTRKPISPTDVKFLEIFARYASDAIENSRLYGKLRRQIFSLKEANRQIIRSRENLIRAEKLSSISKMALDVAHQVRNPLTIIGGYANAQLRKSSSDDPAYAALEIISKQSSRIEQTLDRFSSIVSLSEKKEDKFVLTDLVKEALGMMVNSETDGFPSVTEDIEILGARIFVDQGLFYEAMMVILRESARIVGGIEKVAMEIKKRLDSAIIFIGGGDNYREFAEMFYRVLRDGHGDLRSQEMAVALEILQHYGGDIGIGSSDNLHGWLTIELPLCKEE